MELIKIIDGHPVPYSFAAFRADNTAWPTNPNEVTP